MRTLPALVVLLACKGESLPLDLLVDADPGPGLLLGAWSHGDDVLAVGGTYGVDGHMVRITPDGACLEAGSTDGILWWIHGEGDDWYAVGEGGRIVHGDAWTREDVPTESTLFGVYVDGDTVWAVGGDVLVSQQGEIWRRQDGTWSRYREGLPGLMFKVHDGWFVGDGLAYTLVDGELVERPPPNGEKLLTVRSLGPDHAFAVGGVSQPVLLEWTGGAWTSHEVPLECAGSGGLNGVYTDDGETVHIAGNQGAAATRHPDGTWSCPEAPVTFDSFHAVWAHDGEVLWLGGNLFGSPPYHASIAVDPGRGGPVTLAACP
ncbi:MAG: hypothetical protein H6736_05675 [Alphaproteobacteria bacterium]|nr:hypothetical protein [Alphaproteobacteria bacterium]MCB9691289.1 hypothetical protein [Alphaproteobacteria bacterium]